ncbi:hypothetical protein [Nocardia terpenica]|uniref:hypothetical protein n=1 Tax=Nocardia terpenica TaxID=455432 RepID=UPI000AA71136|nr:hypothetical protein [Nocardia terpenica]
MRDRLKSVSGKKTLVTGAASGIGRWARRRDVAGGMISHEGLGRLLGAGCMESNRGWG